jgi:hypothetical protein
MINAWEDDPFGEAAPTPNPTMSVLIDQAVTAPPNEHRPRLADHGDPAGRRTTSAGNP